MAMADIRNRVEPVLVQLRSQISELPEVGKGGWRTSRLLSSLFASGRMGRWLRALRRGDGGGDALMKVGKHTVDPVSPLPSRRRWRRATFPSLRDREETVAMSAGAFCAKGITPKSGPSERPQRVKSGPLRPRCDWLGHVRVCENHCLTRLARNPTTSFRGRMSRPSAVSVVISRP